jgi:response regulator RpfG family c-di-GMP phosphodiesterase
LARRCSPLLWRELTMEQKIIRAMCILLVDDKSSVRGSFRMILEIDDHAVTEANNGAEALDVFT